MKQPVFAQPPESNFMMQTRTIVLDAEVLRMDDSENPAIPSTCVAVLHIRSQVTCREAPLSARLRPFAKSPSSVLFFGTEDGDAIRQEIAALATRETIAAVLIIHDATDSAIWAAAVDWALWARTVCHGLVLGASRHHARQDPAFDFVHMSLGEDDLLAAVGLAGGTSLIAYDLQDLQSLWCGRIGFACSIPADANLLPVLQDMLRDHVDFDRIESWTFRYLGEGNLVEIADLFSKAREFFDASASCLLAWKVPAKKPLDDHRLMIEVIASMNEINLKYQNKM